MTSRATRVFIDGQAGTTGLQISQRLAERDDIEVSKIDPAQRKDPNARARLFAESDVAILCLPDAAALEAVALAAGQCRIIDASTARYIAYDVFQIFQPADTPGSTRRWWAEARLMNRM